MELGKKAKEKLSPAKEDNATTDAADDSSTHIYEEIPDLYSKLGDSNSDIARHKAEAENHVYEEIANNPYNRVGDSNADFKRNKVEIGSEYAEVTLPRGRQATDPLPELPNQGKAKAVEIAGDPIYAEIGESTSHAKRPYHQFQQRNQREEMMLMRIRQANRHQQADPHLKGRLFNQE